MINLSQIDFLGDYDSNLQEDIDESFFIPALSNSNRYDRMAGYFTSGSLSITATGIATFIRNGGTMRILTSPYLNSKDRDILNQYIHEEKSLDVEVGTLLLDQITDDFIRNSQNEALGWMLKNKKLEIHIVLLRDNYGNVLSAEDYDNSSLFHNKVGILYDDSGNIVTFSGSINATANAHARNIEQFDVHCSWIDDYNRHIKPKQKAFEAYWNLDGTKGTITLDLPSAVREKWIRDIPKNMEDLQIMRGGTRVIKAFDYQLQAIDAWFQNGCCGLFNMATGTGKTFTALFAIKRLFEQIKEEKILVIAVPNTHLIDDPWISSMDLILDLSSPKTVVVKAMDDSKIWNSKLINIRSKMRLDKIDTVIVLTTYDALSNEKMIDFIIKSKAEKILVADEVHNIGTEKTRKGMLEEYNYRLGLSATPERYLDDDGTHTIQDYFVKEVFTFPLEKAIKEINPATGETFLTPYYYYPVFITLTETELEEYMKKTREIAKFGDVNELNPQEIYIRNQLLIKRAKILQDASNKLSVFEKKIPEYEAQGIFDHCLVYCASGKGESDERFLESVIGKLNKAGVVCRRFTSEDKTHLRTNSPHSDEEDRKTILKKFAEGSYNALVAIKCLDEGVDVPATKNAIILASTGNPREYIQRRGRVLRRAPNKEYAIIYDFFVSPSPSSRFKEADQSIFNTEYRRFKEFADLSINKDENYQIIDELIRKYNLKVM